MTCNIIPYGDRILVKRIQAEEKTSGGIIIPDAAKEKPMCAKVVAVGKGSRKENGDFNPIDLKEGDTVYFTKYSGSELKDCDGNEYLILSERDVIAKHNH
jgi:chaperonin GroES